MTAHNDFLMVSRAIQAERADAYAELRAVPRGQIIPAHLLELDRDLNALSAAAAGVATPAQMKRARKLIAQ